MFAKMPNKSEDVCETILPPAHLSFFSMSAILLFCLLTVPGNLMVFLAVLKDPNNDLQNHFSLLIANLALADLIAGIVTEPAAVSFTLLEINRIPPPLGLVYVTHLSYFISCQASVLTLIGLTTDRYLAITRPLWYRANVDITRSAVIICIIWTCAIGLSMIYLRVGFVTYGFVFANTAVVSAIVVFLFSYLRIFRAIREHVRELISLSENTREANHRRREIKWESKLTKTYLMMLICFLICYIPSCVLIYTVNLCAGCSCVAIHWLRDMQFILILSSSSINPILYAWRLSNFRRAFVALVCCSKRRINGVEPCAQHGSSIGVAASATNHAQSFNASEK